MRALLPWHHGRRGLTRVSPLPASRLGRAGADVGFGLLVVLLYGSLVGGLFSPFVFHLGDPALHAAQTKHHAAKWRHLDLDFSEQPFYYPYRDATFYTESFIGQGLLFAPFADVGVVVTAHLLYWLGQTTSLLAMMLFLSAWTRRRWVRLLVAALWVFNPIRASTDGFQAHPQLLWDFPVILGAYGITRWLQTNRRRWALFAALCLWGQIFFSAIYPLTAGLILAGAVLGGWMSKRSVRVTRKVEIAVWVAAVVAGLWLLSAPYRRVSELFQVEVPEREIRAESMALSDSFRHPRYPLWTQAAERRWPWGFSGDSVLPGVSLTLLFLLSLRDLRTNPRTAWALLLCGAYWLLALGPVIEWSKGQELVRNQPWIWATEHIDWIDSIRVPRRFKMGMHWVAAWQVALFLDRLRLPSRRLAQCDRPAVALLLTGAALALVFVTDLRIRQDLYPTPVLGSPVHAAIPPGAVAVELPSGGRLETRFLSLALAVEREFYTLNGQASFEPPLAARLQELSHRGLDEEWFEVFDAVGVTHVILDCHSFRKLGRRCGPYREALVERGFRQVSAADYRRLFAREPPRPVAMAYDLLPLASFEWSVRRPGEDRYELHAKPVAPLFVAFPDRCYDFEMREPRRELVQKLCYRSTRLVAQPNRWPLHVSEPAERVVVSTTAGERVAATLQRASPRERELRPSP